LTIPRPMAFDNLAFQMAEKTNDQLQAIFEKPEDWKPEALDLAGIELQKRGFPAPVAKWKPEVRRCRGAFTLQGIGTTFYGQRDFRRDGTYITTEWLVFIFIPVLPIRSLRVRYQDGVNVGFFYEQNYSVYEKSFPNWKQVVSTYGYICFIFAWIYFICMTATSIFPHALDTIIGVTMIFISCIIPIPTPWILRHYAMRKLRI
jgi:hypothetical protein